MKGKQTLLFSIFLFTSISIQSFAGPTGTATCDAKLPKSLTTSIESGVSWNQYITHLYQRVLPCNDQPNIGILNIIDEAGYPVGLPIYFEFKESNFYFASNALSRRNESLKKNPHVSLLIYYKSLNQSTLLIKGDALLTKKSYQYSGVDKKHTQVIYKIVPNEVNISFLDDASRKKEGIMRNLYVYKKDGKAWQQSKRKISIQTALDDLEERMKQNPPKVMLAN